MAQGATTPAKKRAQAAANGKRIATLEQWAQAALHTVTCPSGAQVKVRIPDLATLLAGDAVPEHLRVVAFQKISDELSEALIEKGEGENAQPRISQEVMNAAVELHRWVVIQSVVEPKLTVETLELVPAEDIEFLAEIATRERDTDALGVHLGVAPLSRFDTFRHFHKCAEDCSACQEVRAVFSTYRTSEL
jgi:hypothetical protein